MTCYRIADDRLSVVAGWILRAAGAVVLVGCGISDGDRVAEVGDKAITVGEYLAYARDLPEDLRSSQPGLAGHLENLQSLVDKELLVMAAHDLGLPDDPEFRRMLNSEIDRRVLKQYYETEVRLKIQVSDEEIGRAFRESGRDRALRFALWGYPTEEEARAGRERLRRSSESSGQDSLYLMAPGERYLARDSVQPSLGWIYRLGLGELSEPTAHKGGYLIARVLDELPLELERYRTVVRNLVANEKYGIARKERVEDLRRRYSPQLDAEGFTHFLVEAADAPTARTIEAGTPLCRYQGGVLTSGRLIEQVMNHGRLGLELSDSAAVAAFAHDVAIPEELALKDARQLGIEGPIRDGAMEQYERRLVDELLRRTVKTGITVTYEEAESYYLDHPELFTANQYVHLREILVGTRDEAEALRQLIEQGADMAEQARRHTLRSEAKEDSGRFHLHSRQAPLYGGLAEAAKSAKVGELTGPVEVEGGFSIFQVLDSFGEPASFADRRVQFAARNIVQRSKEIASFERYTEDLRRRYEARVKVYPQRLREATEG
ncbi:peptidyl-prolyl cis-trans isomerase [Candidatus Latescibacterota bacterium]